ncbi:hypothetical protein T484DRAFT_1762053 [Baffinella frigidus]|nr:hypothetical protein T484DRAFT_1762053 [Cryptophyta sp. CCMP2293]
MMMLPQPNVQKNHHDTAMTFTANTSETEFGTARSIPTASHNVSVEVHLNRALSHMKSVQQPPTGIDYSNTPWPAGPAPPHGSFQHHQTIAGVAASTPIPAFPSQSNNHLLATIQQQAAAFAHQYKGLFGQIEPQASLQRTVSGLSATATPLSSASQPLYNHPANNLSSLLANSLAKMPSTLQRASVYPSIMPVPTLLPSITVQTSPIAPSITVQGTRIDGHKACKIFQLRCRASAGDDPMEQAAAGRSTVVAEMMHVAPKAVRDIWSRSVGAQFTRSLWSEHEKLLDSCDKFKTATGIATSENRKSGPSKAARDGKRRASMGEGCKTPSPRATDAHTSASPRPGKRARADVCCVLAAVDEAAQ